MERRNDSNRSTRQRQLWLALHKWVGLAATLPLIVLAVTGALLALQPEFQKWTGPAGYDIQPDGDPAPHERVLQRITNEYPTAHLIHTSFPKAHDEPYTVFANRPDPDGDGREGFALLVDPYTLEIHRREGRGGWIGVVESIHRNLVLGGIGRWVTGVSSVVLLALTITGLVVWWPIRWGTLRRVRRVGNSLAWHNVLGLFSAPVILLIAVTGASFMFGWVIFPVAETLTGTEPAPPTPESKSPPEKNTLAPSEAIAEARAHLAPEDRITAIAMPGGTDGVIKLHLAQEGVMHQHGWRRLYLDRATAEVLGRVNYWEQGLGAAYRRSFWAWHTGEPLGLGGRLLWGLAGAALAGIIGTGAVWWWRKGQTRRSRKRRSIWKRTSVRLLNTPQSGTPAYSDNEPVGAKARES
jgi:uncharacterized iron-regulated membrane protein